MKNILEPIPQIAGSHLDQKTQRAGRVKMSPAVATQDPLAIPDFLKRPPPTEAEKQAIKRSIDAPRKIVMPTRSPAPDVPIATAPTTIAKGNDGVHSKEALRQSRKKAPIVASSPISEPDQPIIKKSKPEKTAKGSLAGKKITPLVKEADLKLKGGRLDRAKFVLKCKTVEEALKMPMEVGHVSWLAGQGIIKID